MRIFCCALFFAFFIHSSHCIAQKYTHADSLKGTYSEARSWWDVNHYDISVVFSINDSSISGVNRMKYTVLRKSDRMQIDLLPPMILDSVVQDGKLLDWQKDGAAYFINLQSEQALQKELIMYFHGRPLVAKNAPWDGGIIWGRDSKNEPFISIACQGMAARVWFPNKDHMRDEVESASVNITVPRNLVAVSNGKLSGISLAGDKSITYSWAVKNPINNYNIIPYIGRYQNLRDTLNGKNGVLDLDYWVLEENYNKASTHFAQVKPMLRCFEYWFGSYPFYEDGYKLVEAPFLGMEHQSAIAYGNNYKQGYMGRDLSQTGWGLKWDFIIVHESGHEWFGNNISAADVADNWIHEGFTAYSENLYTEFLYGKKAGSDYVIGTRSSILNDKPVISDYSVNAGGSIDVYYKASNMLHTIRQVVNNDSLWRACLTGLNKNFRHQTVTTRQVEDYMISFLKTDLQKVFDQYLRTIQVPVLEYKVKGEKISYRWNNCVKDFNLPVRIVTPEGGKVITPSQKWQVLDTQGITLQADSNYFVRTFQVK